MTKTFKPTVPTQGLSPTQQHMLAIMAKLQATLDKAQQACALDDWNCFLEPMDAPQDLAVAIMTGRPELVKLAQPRALTQDECAVVFKMLSILLETNSALREHAALTAQLVGQWTDSVQAIFATAGKIEDFANYRPVDRDTVDEE
jgi:hypothetical protein